MPAAPEAFFSLRDGSHPPFESPVNTGLKHTEKYTRAVDSLKREAIDSLPDISL